MMNTAITAEASGRLSARPPSLQRLVEEIADRRAERPRQDERRPEQQHARDVASRNKAPAITASPAPKTSAPPS